LEGFPDRPVEWDPEEMVRVNALYFGDNLDMSREHIDDESVDLIYLAPRSTARPHMAPCLVKGGGPRRRRYLCRD